MNADFIIEKKIRDNPDLRRSFNRLAMQTWGFDFEDWYQNGYWGESYIPYTMVHEGRAAANVSVNLMTFAGPDRVHRYIQLGTVMTAPEYRRQGLCRRLMEEIDRDFDGQAEGFYLFANDSVLDFYPRFGYRAVQETGYSIALPAAAAGAERLQAQSSFQTGRCTAQKACVHRVSVKTSRERAVLEQAIARSAVCGRFDMRDNPGLILFYVTKFMQENVYFIPSLDAYVIAERKEDTLLLHSIFAPSPVDPVQAAIALRGLALQDPARKGLNLKIPEAPVLEAPAFGGKFRRLELGFTPADPTGYTRGVVQEEDTTLFIRGAGLEGFERETKRFPTLSHA